MRGSRGRWLVVVFIALGIWAVGAYLPALSNLWAVLNIVTPAGRPAIANFPFAYPAVGVDGHTLVSLLGLLLVIGGISYWLSLLSKAVPAPALTAPQPDPATQVHPMVSAPRPGSGRDVN